MRRALTLLIVGALAALGVHLASPGDAPLPSIPTTDPGAPEPGPPRLGGERDRELLALEKLPTGTIEQVDVALARWIAFRDSLGRDEEYAEVCAMRIAQLGDTRERLAREAFRKVAKHIENHERARRYDQAIALLRDIEARFPDTVTGRNQRPRRENLEQLAIVRPQLFLWHLNFGKRVGGTGSGMVGARFDTHHPRLSILEAEGYQLVGGQFRLRASGQSRLTIGFHLDELPPELELALTLGSSTHFEVPLGSLTQTVNGKVLFTHWAPTDAHPNLFRWSIRSRARVGENRLTLTLDPRARTFVTLFDVQIIGLKK